MFKTPRDMPTLFARHLRLHHRPGFVQNMLESIVFQLGASVLHSSIDASVKRLGLVFRETLYNDLHRRYFEGLTYYKVAFVDKRLQVGRKRGILQKPFLWSACLCVFRMETKMAYCTSPYIPQRAHLINEPPVEPRTSALQRCAAALRRPRRRYKGHPGGHVRRRLLYHEAGTADIARLVCCQLGLHNDGRRRRARPVPKFWQDAVHQVEVERRVPACTR